MTACAIVAEDRFSVTAGIPRQRETVRSDPTIVAQDRFSVTAGIPRQRETVRSDSTIATSTPGSCAPVPSRVVQPLSSLTATSTLCTPRLAVSRCTGKRFGDKPEKDKAANGLVVVRLAEKTPKGPSGG